MINVRTGPSAARNRFPVLARLTGVTLAGAALVGSAEAQSYQSPLCRTTRISVDANFKGGDSFSHAASLSADGRHVAFLSNAENLTGGVVAPDPWFDVIVVDRDLDGNGIFDETFAGARSINRITRGFNGGRANGHSFHPDLSADGRFVAFISDASNLMAPDNNGFRDVFVHDRDADENGIFDEPAGIRTLMVSVRTGGAQGNGHSSMLSGPSISGSGRFVAFDSAASNFIPGDLNDNYDVFVHDRDPDGNGIFDEPGQTNTRLVSKGTAGVTGNGGSGQPVISADGSAVAYMSYASDTQGAAENNGHWDVFAFDVAASTIELVSVGIGGLPSDRESERPSISADGRFVAFQSWASNLVPGDTNGGPGCASKLCGGDVFVFDRTLDAMERVSVSSSALEANDLAEYPKLSADGRFVTFGSFASNLVPANQLVKAANAGKNTTHVPDETEPPEISEAGLWNLYVYDRSTQVIELVNVGFGSNNEATGQSVHPDISQNGLHIAFTGQAASLTGADQLEAHVYVRDCVLSVVPTGTGPVGPRPGPGAGFEGREEGR